VNDLLSRFSQHPLLSKRLLARTCRGRPLTTSHRPSSCYTKL